jgi:serine/threonine protein kinase
MQIEIALEFARGMAYMHSRQPVLIHRDLKPANIMIGGSSFMLSDTSLLLNSAGSVKVADFGLSKSLPKLGLAGAKSDTRGAMHTDKYTLTGDLRCFLRASCLSVSSLPCTGHALIFISIAHLLLRVATRNALARPKKDYSVPHT